MVGVGSPTHSTLTSRPSSSLSMHLSTSEPNQSRVWCRRGGILCGAHRSEYVHFASKWHPTMNLAIKCAEKSEKNTWHFVKIGVGSPTHSTLTSRPSSSLSMHLSTSEPNQSRVWCRRGGILCGAHRSEYVHFASKWHPTMNLAIKCAEKSEKNTWHFVKMKVPQTWDL